jgi:hypothetical protein
MAIVKRTGKQRQDAADQQACGRLLVFCGMIAQKCLFGGTKRILIIRFQSRLSHVVLLALLFRLAVDEPAISLKDREGTISTPFRKIFAIICLSPVFYGFL